MKQSTLIITQILSWRLVLTIVGFIAIIALPFKDSFPYRDSLLEPLGPQALYSWANFDGVHYLGIAKSGYFADFTQAFFPLYPLTIRYLSLLLHNPLISGLVISHLFLFLALITFYRLVRLDFSIKTARLSLFFLLLFPTSFYFGSLYTESLFLFLTLLSFYFHRKGLRFAAILVAALATATRFVGIFIIPALLFERFAASSKRPKIIHLLPYLLGFSGLFIYMAFLNKHFSDPLLFLNSQPAFGADRSVDKIILLYQVIFRYLKMLVTVPINSLLYFTVSQELILSLFSITLSLISLLKIRISYAIFALGVLITPTLTGTFSSMPRYALVAFPIFIVMATIKSKPLRRFLLIASAILLIINTALFTRGYWIS